MSEEKKKRPSLLLEVLLACALLTACLGPLIKKPIELYQTQIKALRELEGQRLADLAFAEIKIKLLNHQIAWDKSSPSKKTPKKIYPPYRRPSPNPPLPRGEGRQKKLSSSSNGKKSAQKGELVRLLGGGNPVCPFEEKNKNPFLPIAIEQSSGK